MDAQQPPPGTGVGCAVRSVRVNETAIVSVRGDLDLVDAGTVRSELGDVLTHGEVTRVWLDLSRVLFIDSVGVGTLVWAMKQARTFRVEFELVAPSEAIMPVLQVLGIDRIIPIRRAGG